MKQSLQFALLFILIYSFSNLKAQENKKMEWFEDAKLGIFIHWGIYSVDGISESWAFFNNYINHDNYMKQLNGFTASKYNPNDWTQLIKNSGAKYAVITTRHHDGVSLWDSKAEKSITTVKNAAAKKDVLSSFVTSLQKTGLKTGLYYSLPDWTHPYYDVATRTKKRYELKNDQKKWADFVQYYQTQLRELSTAYKPDLIWFDGDWEHNSEEWKAKETLELLKNYNRNIVINSRLNGHGDYATPEQGVPVVAPQDKYWELCYTMNDSWGYQPFDNNYKSPNMIVRTLVDCISMGGNLLIDIGPKEDGTIPTEQVEILKNLGRWTSINSDAIYGTRRGIPFENYNGKSALSKDGKKLFLYLEEEKTFSKIYNITSTPKKVRIIGDNDAKLSFKNGENSILTIDYQVVKFDKDVTVVELEFDEPLKFSSKTTSKTENLSSILENKNAKQSTYQLAYQLSKGNNLLNDKISVDGENMPLKNDSKINSDVYNWIRKHAEAFYETNKGLDFGHYQGISALSKDRQTLYLFVEGKPTGPIALKGLKNTISRIRIVGEGSIINYHIFNKLYWSPIPGIVYIDIPKERLDKNLTVIAILLDKPLEVYREEVKAIESNL